MLIDVNVECSWPSGRWRLVDGSPSVAQPAFLMRVSGGWASDLWTALAVNLEAGLQQMKTVIAIHQQLTYGLNYKLWFRLCDFAVYSLLFRAKSV